MRVSVMGLVRSRTIQSQYESDQLAAATADFGDMRRRIDQNAEVE